MRLVEAPRAASGQQPAATLCDRGSQDPLFARRPSSSPSTYAVPSSACRRTPRVSLDFRTSARSAQCKVSSGSRRALELRRKTDVGFLIGRQNGTGRRHRHARQNQFNANALPLFRQLFDAPFVNCESDEFQVACCVSFPFLSAPPPPPPPHQRRCIPSSRFVWSSPPRHATFSPPRHRSMSSRQVFLSACPVRPDLLAGSFLALLLRCTAERQNPPRLFVHCLVPLPSARPHHKLAHIDAKHLVSPQPKMPWSCSLALSLSAHGGFTACFVEPVWPQPCSLASAYRTLSSCHGVHGHGQCSHCMQSARGHKDMTGFCWIEGSSRFAEPRFV